jgi:RNA polymerase sigma-70 factor (ECF subfamily)
LLLWASFVTIEVLKWTDKQIETTDNTLQESIDNTTINVDEQDLIRRCQRGDQKAMEILIVRYQDRLYNTILKICSNPEDAAELTQETFVKVIEKITTFKGKSTFYTWLFRIGMNLTLTFCKRRRRLPVQSLDGSLNVQADTAANRLSAYLTSREKLDPADLAQDREIRQILLQTLERLDEDHRAVLVLRDIEGMNYHQIAQILEVELGTVKSRISRARANLKELLETVLA